MDGITLIYGDNGVGKSGYCRVAKKLCRSLSKDELLGNVFESGQKPAAKVSVRYLPDGAEEVIETDWVDGQLPPDELAGISVFDSRNATIYVTKQNKVEFLPAEVVLLEQHAAHRSEMAATFGKEKAALERRLVVLLPGGYGSVGPVADLLKKLQLPRSETLPSRDAVEKLAAWTPDLQSSLDALETALGREAQSVAAQSARDVDVLESTVTQIEEIQQKISEAKAQSLAEASRAASETAAAAKLAATQGFDAEAIPGVGSEAWRLMYDYAKAYLLSADQDDGFAVGDPCAMCQRPLDEESSARLKRFQAFVEGEATKAAESAATSFRLAKGAVGGCIIPDEGQVRRSLAEFASRSAQAHQLAAEVERYFRLAQTRKAALSQVEGVVDPAMWGEAPRAPLDELRREIASLNRAAANVESPPAFRDADLANLTLLRDRKKLSQDLPIVLARLEELETYDRLVECIALVNNQPVSLQITTTRRELISADLEKRIRAEIEGLLLSHIPFTVNDGSTQGESWFRVLLKNAPGVSNERVLSEGEQRALALACFLAETGGDGAKNGLIIDDPVSSLDHLRIRRVAERLVAEAAKGKQLIVFTHNLLFYNEVVDAAARSDPAVPLARRLVFKSEQQGFGVIADDVEPWMVRPVNERIVGLRNRVAEIREGGADPSSDDYRRQTKDFYSDLRETWERLVEELLLGKVVERLSSDVKTQSLKGVHVTDADYKTVFWAMKRASERSGHDRPVAKDMAALSSEEMLADVAKLDDYRKELASRRKQLQQQREALEEPPQATTM